MDSAHRRYTVTLTGEQIHALHDAAHCYEAAANGELSYVAERFANDDGGGINQQLAPVALGAAEMLEDLTRPDVRRWLSEVLAAADPVYGPE